MMKIGILTIELFLSQSHSLKYKRYVLNQIKDKLQKKYNISITEVDYHDKWQRSVIGIAHVNNSVKKINNNFDRILNFFETNKNGYEVLNSHIEIL